MKKIVKIVTFYEDGTFTESTPSPYMPTVPYVPNPLPMPPVGPYPSPYPNPYPWPQVWCSTTTTITTDDPESKN